MKISNNSVVSITYTLQESDSSGEVIQEVQHAEPFVFLFGHNQVLPQFETNLIDQTVGDTFEFGIKSEEGYGEREPEAVTDLPIALFMQEGKLSDAVQLGHYLPMNDQEGNQLQGLVLEIGEETVKMDFNHPMAGVDLFFTGTVIDVREASAEELAEAPTEGGSPQ